MPRHLWIAVLLALMFTACSKHQPPVQMMAEARAAIQAAHKLTPQASLPTSSLTAADQALHQAAQALGEQHFGEARKQAKRARDLARQVIAASHKKKITH
ncbi:MAG: hypothetical protein R8J85_04200 [Mariprofundales bacterium]